MTFARAWAHIAEVAILTDPGGSVLRSSPAVGRRSRKRCDPHRPRRVGAATNGAVPVFRESPGLRSSPTPEGRCCGPASRATDWRTHRVAILTDPGGSVLPGTGGHLRLVLRLRSSPTPEGRCCPWPLAAAWTTRPGCCDPHRPRRVGAAELGERPDDALDGTVAILTDPGGSVLPDGQVPDEPADEQLRSSPTPEGRCCAPAPSPSWPGSPGCDPHRPRRVGAALPRVGHHAARYDVAILTDPGGSVLPIGRRRAGWSGGWWLRSSPTPEGRCCPRSTPTTTCRASSSCDPHRPRRVGAACLTYGSWPAANSGPGCDPHRPRRVGAARRRGG